jgi:hypothetical protein
MNSMPRKLSSTVNIGGCVASALRILLPRGRAGTQDLVPRHSLCSLVPNSLNSFDFTQRYGEPDSWFESYSLRHNLRY